ncbi:MAG: HEAT repeat domain-containing protein [Pirellulaceae bacterium]|nr:HEAT repeat domain-containing protein [Pirellulaceae bacterium]
MAPLLFSGHFVVMPTDWIAPVRRLLLVSLIAVGVSLAPVSLAPGVAADTLPVETVEFSGGGHLSGQVLKEVDSGKVPFVVVRVDDGISVAIQKNRVSRVRTKNELTEYARLADEAGNDPEKHYEHGRWCAAHNLSAQKQYHYQRAIAIDPQHERARAALEYVRDDQGNWVSYAQQQRNRGLILVGGRWQFPEAVAKDRFQDEQNVKASKWIKELARLRAQAMRNNSKSAESLAAIKAIKDPLATGAIAGELIKSRGKDVQPRALRMEWIKLLGQFRNSQSVRALVMAGIDEPDPVVREAALKQLQEYGSRSAIATYVPMLNPKKSSNNNVKKALRALTFFPDRELAMTYIDALVTTHTREVTSGGGTNAGFTDDGSGGFSTGSKKVVVTDTIRNDDAHRLLIEVEPGADYGFDQQAWREHFARQLTSYEGSLRRDP